MFMVVEQVECPNVFDISMMCCCQARKPSNGTAVDAGFFKPTDESCVRSQNLSGTHGIEFGDS